MKIIHVYGMYTSQSYKNRDERDKTYQNLADLMGIDDFDKTDVKAKIRSIRNVYALELELQILTVGHIF